MAHEDQAALDATTRPISNPRMTVEGAVMSLMSLHAVPTQPAADPRRWQPLAGAGRRWQALAGAGGAAGLQFMLILSGSKHL
jgi:hypothetical protein